MSDWDEIQRLAADLQRAQLDSASQKLSEKNCIEIVNRLVEGGLLDVVYTTDGKEYLTLKHLQREILDELHLARGRIGLPELATTLTLDYSVVENQAQHLVKSGNDNLFLVLGQLISSNYLDTIAEEINDKLQADGFVSIPVITKDYDLPTEFVQEQVTSSTGESRLGKIIEGFRDDANPNFIVTTAHLTRNRAKVRGALRAVTVPTQVSTIVNRFHVENQLFLRLAEELIRDGSVQGSLVSKSLYIPAVYSKAQHDWVDNFYTQNSYLEYDGLQRIGISDPKSFVRKKFKDQDEELTFLSSCCVGKSFIDQLEANVEEAVGNGSFVEVSPFLPSILSAQDISILLHQSLNVKRIIIMSDTVVTCRSFLERLLGSFKETVNEKAHKAVTSGDYGRALKRIYSSSKGTAKMQKESISCADDPGFKDKKEERRRKAAGSGKGGGGVQGREGKTKSTKKKNRVVTAGGGGSDDDKDAEDGPITSVDLGFMDLDEVSEALRGLSVLRNAPHEFVRALADELHPTMTKQYRQLASEVYGSTMNASAQKKRRCHAEFQDKTLALVDNLRLFERGTASLDGDADKLTLDRYLLKSLGAELVNGIFLHAAAREDEDSSSQVLEGPLNADQRLKLFASMDRETSEHLLPIHKALAVSSSQLLQALERHLPDACDLHVRKADKKKDRQTLFNHRQSVLDQVESCNKPSELLLLVCLAVFQVQTGNMLHASGKYVPTIVNFLSQKLDEESARVLSQCQALVMEQLTVNKDDQVKLDEIQSQLEALLPRVKDVARNAKKTKNQVQ